MEAADPQLEVLAAEAPRGSGGPPSHPSGGASGEGAWLAPPLSAAVHLAHFGGDLKYGKQTW